MIINHNLMANNAIRNMNINSSNASKSMQKLSSGLRINSAADDAAGLAISEKMRGQIRGLDQASSNAQDAISMTQTAEGALNETTSILQRMRELAVQSANDTNNDTDRGQIQKEVDQLKSEITRISTDTEFNTKKLLNGDMGVKATNTANTANLKSFSAVSGDLADGTYSFAMTAVGADSVAMGSNSVASAGVAGDYTINAAHTLSYGEYTLTTSNLNGTSVDLTLRDQSGAVVASKVGAATNASLTNFGGFDLAFATHNITGEGTLDLTVENAGVNIALTKPDSTTVASGAVVLDDTNQGKFSLGGFDFKVDTAHGAGATTAVYTVANKAATFQIGANQDQNTKLAINDMSATALRVDTVDVSTQAGANTAITTIQTAIDTVSTERAKLGAYSNRLEHTINNLGTSSENLTSAESRIRDVDMAKEMSTFSKNNILSQAAQAMLAQANQQPQQVLQLLR